MKYFIVEITYLQPIEVISQTTPEHRVFLQGGYERGWLLASGPQVPKVGGVIIARAPSLEALKEFFAGDPYQVKGLGSYRFIEFEPVKRQPFMEEWLTA